MTTEDTTRDAERAIAREARYAKTALAREVATTVEQQLAEMLSPLDVPLSWSHRLLEKYEMDRCILTNRKTTLRMESATVDRIGSQLDQLIPYRDTLIGIKATLAAELEAIGKPQTGLALGKQQNLLLSLRALEGTSAHGAARFDDYGYAFESLRLAALLREAGVTFNGSIVTTLHEIARLEPEYADAEYRVDQALLSPEEHEAKAKADLAESAVSL